MLVSSLHRCVIQRDSSDPAAPDDNGVKEEHFFEESKTKKYEC